MGKMAIFALAALLSASPASAIRMDPFDPEFAPTGRVEIAVDVIPGILMPMVKCSVDGRECSLLLDTGATHTTFDEGFFSKSFPDAPRGRVVMAGTTNVKNAPSATTVISFRAGDAEFGSFTALVLDLSHLSGAFGRRVDGVLGMNILGKTPLLLSLKSGNAVFNPREDERASFAIRAERDGLDRLSIAFSAKCFGKTINPIVDSGASITFVEKSSSWPVGKSGEERSIEATDVNGSAVRSPESGQPGRIELDEGSLEIEPALGDGICCIGADTLGKYDMFCEKTRVSFRPAEKKAD